ncbi:hypothetical protein EV426DRAFT_137740 [Tirmania nivea]|nr:hypothetical protein EV426DRAFT_137740 [Tirmania nivea]
MQPRKHISTASILAPLLLLAPALVASSMPWPFANDANPQSPAIKYWPHGTKPSEETIQALKHQHELRSLPRNAAPVAVRKMPPEESEKFYHYSDPFVRSIPGYFSPEEEVSVLGARSADSSDPFFGLQAPHYGAPLPQLLKRQFSCPANHYACDSINAPAYCCRVDEQCIKIQDTGMGTVGCCPDGQKCEGPLKDCNSDQVTCDASQGGGCCVKGYQCSPNGCVPDNSSPTVEGAQTTQPCSSGSYACPSTLAGGCCATGRACGVDLCLAAETQQLPPPVPTDTCPTGFYSCAPRFNGGCCRIGRDCAMTNCPARTTGPITVGDEIKTTPTSVFVPTGSCQTGWYSCPPSFNGGCCPTRYDCGVTNCPANTLAGKVPPEIKRMPVSTGSAEVRAAGVKMVREVVVIVGVVVGVNAFA